MTEAARGITMYDRFNSKWEVPDVKRSLSRSDGAQLCQDVSQVLRVIDSLLLTSRVQAKGSFFFSEKNICIYIYMCISLSLCRSLSLSVSLSLSLSLSLLLSLDGMQG